MTATALIALGSNRRTRYGRPTATIAAATEALRGAGLEVDRVSRPHDTAPIGPGSRRYANAALVARTALAPAALLALLKQVEAAFGRRAARRWGDRALDLDLVGYDDLRLSGRVTIPHPRAHQRRFVLDPLVEIAPGWRHPVLGATVRQLRARLRKPKPRRAGP